MNVPVRKTTAALLARAAADYQRAINEIATLAVADGEASPGTLLAVDLSDPAAATWQAPASAELASAGPALVSEG